MRIGAPGLGATTAEVAFIMRPDYAETVLARRTDSQVKAEFERIKHNFDAKPLVVQCDRRECSRVATKATARGGTVALIFWCPECFPGVRRAARLGGLSTIETFSDAMRYIDRSYPRGNKVAKRLIIRALLRAKGMAPRIREGSAWAFFDTPVSGGP